MTTKIEIPAGLKLPYRPDAKFDDKVLFLTQGGGIYGPGEVFEKNIDGWPENYRDRSWAIVNGPVSKGDWVIALEYRFGVNQPDGRKLGDLLRVDGSPVPRGYLAGTVRAVDGTNGPRYLSKWAKVLLESDRDSNQACAGSSSPAHVELADKRTEPTGKFEAADRVIINNPWCDPKWNGPGTIIHREPDDYRGRPWYYVHSDNYGGAGGFEASNLKPLEEKPKKPSEPTLKVGDKVEVYGWGYEPWNGFGTIKLVQPQGYYIVDFDRPQLASGGFHERNIRPDTRPQRAEVPCGPGAIIKTRSESPWRLENVTVQTWVDVYGDKWYRVFEDSWISPADAGSGYEVHSGSFEKLVQKYGEN